MQQYAALASSISQALEAADWQAGSSAMEHWSVKIPMTPRMRPPHCAALLLATDYACKLSVFETTKKTMALLLLICWTRTLSPPETAALSVPIPQ